MFLNKLKDHTSQATSNLKTQHKIYRTSKFQQNVKKEKSMEFTSFVFLNTVKISHFRKLPKRQIIILL